MTPGEITASSERSERKPCVHNSARSDGWLDDRCMVCGMNGYWVAGEQIPTKVHPSGKLLIRALPASAVEGLVEALEDVLAAARLVTGPHPPASPKADELLKKSRAALATFKTQTGRD